MSRYAQHVSTKVTPQSEPVPGKQMVPNSAGGYGFQVDDWTRLDRFLVLGNEGGTYYASERKLTRENADCVLRCANLDPERAAEQIAVVSEQGRAPKNDPAIFALALMASQVKQPGTVKAAFARLNRVCRTGTHLFQFVAACDEMRGWGRGMRTALTNWYASKPVGQLAYQLVKYQSRVVVQGDKAKKEKGVSWSHRDIMRKVRWSTKAPIRLVQGANGKPRYEYLPTDDPRDILYRWVNQGWEGVGTEPHPVKDLQLVWAFERAKRCTSVRELVPLIRDYRLPRECVPTQFLTDPAVWEALLPGMPLHALVRNLGNLTRAGVLAPLGDAVKLVTNKLADREHIKRSRLHPLSLLVALNTYRQGRGDKGKHTWSPVGQVVDALDGAFYLAFDAVEPTGKNHLLAVDISGSMNSGTVGGMPGITPRIGAAVMTLVTQAVERNTHTVAFTCDGWGKLASKWGNRYPSGLSELAISPKQRLDDVVRTMQQLSHRMGGTDCALPMLYAAERKLPVDAFIVYTDNETWAGSIHPCQSLEQYRQKMGRPAKLIVVGMTATEFSIADPGDPDTMDVVGFDTAAPAVMANFVRDCQDAQAGTVDAEGD